LDTSPTPVADFGESQRLALALTGTVALPSPYPASAEVFLGINPFHDDALPMGSPKFFLKGVQRVSAKQVTTRIFSLSALRAVGLPTATGEEYCYPTRRTHLIEGEIAEKIKTAQQHLQASAAATSGSYEVALFADAVLYVREATPVLMHIVSEFGVTAAESVETGFSGCCFEK
jgi:hypothetical protein